MEPGFDKAQTSPRRHRGRRRFALSVFTATVSTLLMGQAPDAEESLKVITWDGAYKASQEIAYFKPFAKKTGVSVEAETYDGSLKAIKEAIAERGAADVIDVSSGVLAKLCDEKQLAPIDPTKLLPAAEAPEATEADDADTANSKTTASTSAEADFIEDTVSSCGIGSVAWSATIVFDKHAFKTNAPGKAAEFFDIETFPGKRALPKGPRYTLELALLADGVAPSEVYGNLATPEGSARAFDMLDRIRADIVWWSKTDTPMRLIRDGKAAMGIAYTGRIFQNAVEAPSQVGILWDGQVYEFDHWAIPRTSARKKQAAEFIAFASRPKRLAAHAALTAYGPARKSAIPLVGSHPVVGVEMAKFLPTAPEHLQTALRFDAGWWETHGAEIEKRFNAWREGRSITATETEREGEAPDTP